MYSSAFSLFALFAFCIVGHFCGAFVAQNNEVYFMLQKWEVKRFQSDIFVKCQPKLLNRSHLKSIILFKMLLTLLSTCTNG